MPKRLDKKDSEYLRFRPYRAFATQPAKSDHRKTYARAAWIIAALVLLVFLALLLAHR